MYYLLCQYFSFPDRAIAFINTILVGNNLLTEAIKIRFDYVHCVKRSHL